MIESGVDSLKIEGRMKSIHYVSTSSQRLPQSRGCLLRQSERYELKQEWVDELWEAVAQRELATGFFYKNPTEDEQLFGQRRKIPRYGFIGQVMAYDPETQMATIQPTEQFRCRRRNRILPKFQLPQHTDCGSHLERTR